MKGLPHLRLEGTGESIPYTSTAAGGGGPFKTPARNPTTHATEVKEDLEAARAAVTVTRERERASHADLLQREPGGVVLTFESAKGHSLKLESLEKLKDGIQLRSVSETDGVEKAKVFVPEGKLAHFIKILDDYSTRTVLTVDADQTSRPTLGALADKKGGISVAVKSRPEEQIRARVTCPVSHVDRIVATIADKGTVTKNVRLNTPLVDSIANVRMALVEDFWSEPGPFPSAKENVWWEVWLHGTRRDVTPVQARFQSLATALGFRVARRFVTFPERVVVLAYGTAEQFSQSLEMVGMMAELRRAKELATPYVELSAQDQRAFSDSLIGTVIAPPADAPAVCLLDSGVNRGHLLIEPALPSADAQAVDEQWGTADHDRHQHGTGMAGIALYGCLTRAFSGTGQVQLRHRLESVKVLPPSGANDPDVYGAITQQAVSLAVLRNPERNRAICMAVTANSSNHGLPSSWSGAVDELCAGVLDEMPKLMFISAGNVRDELFMESYRYHEWNVTRAGIEDPAQSWNAITVGAYTEKVVIQDPSLKGYEPIATAGELCPTSRTSLAWPDDHHAGWPIKPDIVCEGGNYAANGDTRTAADDLSLLTTILHPSGRLLDTTRDTSPATAQAARMAAELWSHYPKLRPETVRALLVHSARWTPAMVGRFGTKTKGAVHRRLRCYGYGVPDLDRAVYSLKNAAVLVYEGELQPFKIDPKTKKPTTNEMHLHSLPWPKAQLDELRETPVTMRATLSYFVEPSPGSVGWGANHRYASHGLRYDVIRPLEEFAAFKKRISRAEWDDPKARPKSQKETRRWVVGDDGRTHGSIHSDWWEGTAAELAACDAICVYPVTGWWRERAHLGRVSRTARYSLVISIETPKSDVDLYTPIKTMARVATEVLV